MQLIFANSANLTQKKISQNKKKTCQGKSRLGATDAHEQIKAFLTESLTNKIVYAA